VRPLCRGSGGFGGGRIASAEEQPGDFSQPEEGSGAAARCRRPPRNKGLRYPADPPTIEEIVTVMRRAGDGVHGRRLRGLIVVLWRAGLRICEALAPAEADLDARCGSLLCGAARAVAAARSAWTTGRGEQLAPWLQARVALPVGPLCCIVNGATRGRPWAAAAARTELRRVARQAGVRRRFAPHQLRHAPRRRDGA
jgi:integrase